MFVCFVVLVAVLHAALTLFAAARLAKPLNRHKSKGFARRPSHNPTVIDTPAPRTRKKPEWVVLEVLRLKALMGKNVGCRKVADTFNRLHAPMWVGKSVVSITVRNYQYALLNISRELRVKRPAPVDINSVWA